ncbi:GNAT family N-acetyltransferase [Kineosporia succinea]|uniref:GNAT superfamily N-acetyltransferase n=1 Tax=Kineosporia succinea TaxID=84632 RepID=A0ABT9P452_9ACTN|nr:GNAT family N-acetyltransferase [Kineosporia succinea]MDP9827464.1 GNAT superfamily N-acetyltransferase [Kineosporia succinea]
MREPVTVRPRTPADLPFVAGALRGVHEQDRYPMIWPDDPAAWLDPPGTTAAWVAVETDVTATSTILGHLCVVKGAHDTSVSRLFTTPAARGRGLGLGERLLGEAVRWARDRGEHLVLDVVDDGGPAPALYERLGWRLTGTDVADWATPEGQYLPIRLYRAPAEAVSSESRPKSSGANDGGRAGRRGHDRRHGHVGAGNGRPGNLRRSAVFGRSRTAAGDQDDGGEHGQ